MTSALHKLAEKQAERNFTWENEHNEAIQEVEQTLCAAVLCSAPLQSAEILALPNFETNAHAFVLHTDASDVAVASVLSQRDREGREGRAHVTAYNSVKDNEGIGRKIPGSDR
ncbi:hypothetical protein TSMEX_005100 [Taenia solium]|eukprot:TsM_001086800 transcript=TsM_001086800 gene=TsM_001086800